MKTRKLGNSDLHITPVGYGAWAIGGSGWQFAWGSQDDNDSIAAIHRALELGVNWIDTAAVYGLGHSEEVVARALKSWPGLRPYVFTKCGLRWDADGNVRKVSNADSIRREVEESLRRLSVEVIDLYQIHWPPDPDSAELEEGWSTLASLQRQGKVRWIGVSKFSVQQLRRAQAVASVTSLQPRYSPVQPRGRRPSFALLQAAKHWNHRLLSNGFRPADRRDDPRARCQTIRGRLAKDSSRLHRTQSISQSRAG